MVDLAQSSFLHSGFGSIHENDEMNLDGGSQSEQQRVHLDEGLSDDDDDDEHSSLFGGSRESHAPPKSKKKPRSLSDPSGDDPKVSEPSPTKKPRTSIFGGLGPEADEADSVSTTAFSH